MSDYQTALRTACADLGAICALLGFENYPGIDALLKTITNLIADRRLASDRQAPAVEAAQPADGDKQEADNDIEEAREILTLLISSIEKNGPYSAEATCTFIRQALNCLPMGAPLDKGASNEALKSAYRQGYMAGWNRDREAVFAPSVAQGERGACRPFECDVAQREGVTCRDGECERAQIDGAPCWEDDCDIVTRGCAAPSSASEAEAGEPVAVTTAEFETAIETLRHVIDCLRRSGSYTDEEGEATDFLEPLLNARLAAPQPASEQQDDLLRRAVKAVVAMLKNGEYAEHWADAEAPGDADATDLEAAITELVNETHEASEQQAARGLSDDVRSRLEFYAACYCKSTSATDREAGKAMYALLAAKGDGHAD